MGRTQSTSEVPITTDPQMVGEAPWHEGTYTGDLHETPTSSFKRWQLPNSTHKESRPFLQCRKDGADVTNTRHPTHARTERTEPPTAAHDTEGKHREPECLPLPSD